MTASVDRAAALLLESIKAPVGTVNTLGMNSQSGAIIKVLVAPEYWYRIGVVPPVFEGYPVLVEKSSDTIAGSKRSSVARH